MKNITFILLAAILISISLVAVSQKNDNQKTVEMKLNKLTPEEELVIIQKGTEYPYSGKYLNNKQLGIYVCKRCDASLYKSDDKFDSHCGWPAFDNEIKGAVKRILDPDGTRTEIVCTNCGAHLGHVFIGEGFTNKETRHCVNSISLKFIPEENKNVKKAYFASGCFWGTEYYFMKAKGIVNTTVGFMGGSVENPSYEEVCQKKTGHLELVEVDYDSSKTSYDDLVQLFFETHDFTQTNGQGPDIGNQYLSCIFYTDNSQKEIAKKYIAVLNQKGFKVATMLKPISTFWKAENYHQEYYSKKGTIPYCHIYRKIF